MALWTDIVTSLTCKAYYKAGDWTLSSGTVQQLNDKSGNGFHLIQTTVVNRPLGTSSDSLFNNQASVSISGSTNVLLNQFMEVAMTSLAAPGTTPFYIRFVLELPASPADGYPFLGLGGSGVDDEGSYLIGSDIHAYLGNYPASPIAAIPGVIVYDQFYSNSSSDFQRFNHGTKATGVTFGNNDPDRLCVGCNNVSPYTQNKSFKFAELAIWTGGQLTPAELAAIGDLDGTNYNIPSLILAKSPGPMYPVDRLRRTMYPRRY